MVRAATGVLNVNFQFGAILSAGSLTDLALSSVKPDDFVVPGGWVVVVQSSQLR